MGRRAVALIGLVALLACRTYRGGGTAEPPARSPAPAAVSKTGPSGERAPTVPIGSERPGAGQKRTASDPFEDARRRLDEALALEPPKGNFLVRVEKIWLAEGEASSIGALLAYRDENFDVAAGQVSPEAGFRVAVTKGGFSGVLDGFLRSHRSAGREEARIVTAPGYPARLEVGRVRYAAPLRLEGARGVVWFPGGQLIGTSLEVTLRPAGSDRVEIEIVPVFTQEGQGASVELTRARTVIVAPLGRPVLLASDETSSDSVALSLLRRTTSKGEERGVIVLTVTGG